MIVLGIDFGTSNTCISYFDGSNYHIIPNEQGKYTTPSCIYFNPTSDEILYGETAYISLQNPCNIIYNIKRLIGTSYSEFKNNKELEYFFRHLNIVHDQKSDYCSITLTYNNVVQTFSIEYICKLFLQHIISYAETYLNQPVQSAVITVPVQFTYIQRNILKTTFQDINVFVLRILNEPTAATLAYIHNANDQNEQSANKQNANEQNVNEQNVNEQNVNEQNVNENILVVDCGGGTTDFTVLECDYSDMFFEVKQTCGDIFLGGEDITNNLVNYVLSKSNVCFTTKRVDNIKKQCETCKCNLSFTTKDNIFINENQNLCISRPQFISINKVFFDKIKSYLMQITFKINKVIFIGGTTRIPHFVTIVRDIFGKDIVIQNKINPDHTVSIGAAIQGYLLTNNVNTTETETETGTNLDITFLDIAPMSLGVETIGGIMSPIISKSSILPVSKTQDFTNYNEIDNEIEIRVFQGERRLVKDNLFLGSFKIILDKTKKNNVIIQVTFDINSDGILIVTAREKSSLVNEKMLIITDYLKRLDDTYTYSDEFEKIKDSEMSSKILAKIELNNVFQSISYKYFRQQNDIQLNVKLQQLLDKISDIIDNFENYTTGDLIEYKTKFQEQWHITCINL